MGYLIKYHPRVQGTVRKRRLKSCDTQKGWKTPRYKDFQTQQNWYMYELTETVSRLRYKPDFVPEVRGKVDRNPHPNPDALSN